MLLGINQSHSMRDSRDNILVVFRPNLKEVHFPGRFSIVKSKVRLVLGADLIVALRTPQFAGFLGEQP